jgi:hypothetical protein
MTGVRETLAQQQRQQASTGFKYANQLIITPMHPLTQLISHGPVSVLQ